MAPAEKATDPHADIAQDLNTLAENLCGNQTVREPRLPRECDGRGCLHTRACVNVGIHHRWPTPASVSFPSHLTAS